MHSPKKIRSNILDFPQAGESAIRAFCTITQGETDTHSYSVAADTSGLQVYPSRLTPDSLKLNISRLDGSLLGAAVLPVVAAEAPENLTIVFLDNGAFGSTGNQLTNAYGQVDMELLARAAGIRNTCKVQDERELKGVWENRGWGPNFIHAVLRPGNAAVPNILLAPAEIREWFMGAVRG